MIEGVIYKYTSPSGKSYIGLTTNEAHRINTWFCSKYRYAGQKINRARKKYGPEKFIYEVLHRKYYFSKKEATYELDKWEVYYIGYYDTYKNGYNSTIGGLTNRGIKRSPETKEKMRLANLGRKQSIEEIAKRSASLKGIKHSKAATISSKNKRRNSGRLKKIYQFSSEGILLKEWRCIAEAAELLSICDSNIRRAIKTLGKYKGYYWRNECLFIHKTIKQGNRKAIYKKTLKGEIVGEYPSITEAARSIGKPTTLICRCLHNHRATAYNFIWTFK